MAARARLITTSLTAAVTVGSVAAMAATEPATVAPATVAGSLAATVGDAWDATESMAAPDVVAATDSDEPVRTPARLRVRVSG